VPVGSIEYDNTSLTSTSSGLAVKSGSIDTTEINASISPNWTSTHTFRGSNAIDVEGDILGDGGLIWNNSDSHVPTESLEDNSVIIGQKEGITTNGIEEGAKVAYDFDGSGDHLTYPDLSINYSGSADWTTSIWVNPDSTAPGGEAYFLWHPRGQNDMWLTLDDSGELYLGTYGGSTDRLYSGVVPDIGEWTHIVVQSDTSASQQYQIYIGGTQEATGNLGDPASRNATNAIAGQPHNDQNYLDGQMDEIRLYDRALSDSEISSLTDPSSGPSSGLVAHYPLDSKEPSDTSGNNNDPTKNGDIVTVADIGLGSNWIMSVDTSSTFTPTWNGVHNFAAETDFTNTVHVYDDQDVSLGTSKDFSLTYEKSSNDLVVSDSNDVELIRQRKSDTTQFIQGIDAGSIKAPTDSYAQIINTPVTDSLASGDKVGHALALDNKTALSVEGEANGIGGIKSGSISIDVGGSIKQSGDSFFSDVVATGSTTVPASVSTGITAGRPQLYVGIGVEELSSADARVDYNVKWDTSDAEHYVYIYENGTSSNPIVDYTIVRMD